MGWLSRLQRLFSDQPLAAKAGHQLEPRQSDTGRGRVVVRAEDGQWLSGETPPRGGGLESLRITMRRSLERQLPLLASVLLVVVTVALAGLAYREVRNAALAAASERLTRLTHDLGGAMRNAPTRRQALAALMGQAAVREFLRGRGSRALAQRALDQYAALPAGAAANTPRPAVRIARSDGQSVSAGDTALFALAAPLQPGAAGTDSIVLGPMHVVRDSIIFFDATGRMAGGGQVLERRRSTTTPEARRLLSRLLGDASIFLGNAAGDLWTDQRTVVRGPPSSVLGAHQAVPYVRGDTLRLGLAVPIVGSPWAVLVETDRAPVLAPAQRFLRRVAVIGTILLLLGVGGAWVVSRRITMPLRELTAAVAAVAQGDYARRVPAPPLAGDEVQLLAAAFNEMVGRVAGARDDLDRRVAERTAELQTTNQKLETANQELEGFSYSISHDLRAPLRAIEGFARILQEDHAPALDAELRRLLDVIRGNARQMGHLIDDLLEFSRLSRAELKRAPVNMTALAREAYAGLTQLGDERATVEIRDLPPADGDPGLLRQVFTNLVANALKFSASKPAPRVEVAAQTDGAEAVYFVRDNGVGFDQRYAHRLFGVFERLHGSEVEGTGIGLALVHRLVTRHGGRVWAEGKLDEGATFFFTLAAKGVA
jgi:signal transduction histidine kinase